MGLVKIETLQQQIVLYLQKGTLIECPNYSLNEKRQRLPLF